jgi:hypothetical protein
MQANKLKRLIRRVAETLADGCPLDERTLLRRLRVDGLHIALGQLQCVLGAMERRGLLRRPDLSDHQEPADLRRDYLEAGIRRPEAPKGVVQGFIPVYERGDVPPVVIDDLKAEVAGVIGSGQDVGCSAFASGPAMSVRLEVATLNPAKQKPLMVAALTALIRQGADRIVVVSEVWFKDDDGLPTWDGVMILESTQAGETLTYTTREGRAGLGAWETCPAGPKGRLAGLFARARATG